MKLIFVTGTRPNLVKIAPLIKALQPIKNIQWRFVHTGQHYNHSMSDVFFNDLAIPPPTTNFKVGSGSHANQVATVMINFERYCLEEKPDLVVVVGDVNSTLGSALAVSKLPGIKLAHVEAGCRVFDNSPEEINRILVDRLSDYLFCPTRLDRNYAIADGTSFASCYVVGDIAIDTLISILPKLDQKPSKPKYAMFTLHRPASVDNKGNLYRILKIAKQISKQIHIKFPLHPRTKEAITLNGFSSYSHHIEFLPPLGYLECMSMLNGAAFLLTDSGGLQTEAHFLKIPCLTLAANTGHINTVKCNANTLVGTDFSRAVALATNILSGTTKNILPGDFWDGRVAHRILNTLTGYQHAAFC